MRDAQAQARKNNFKERLLNQMADNEERKRNQHDRQLEEDFEFKRKM